MKILFVVPNLLINPPLTFVVLRSSINLFLWIQLCWRLLIFLGGSPLFVASLLPHAKPIRLRLFYSSSLNALLGFLCGGCLAPAVQRIRPALQSVFVSLLLFLSSREIRAGEEAIGINESAMSKQGWIVAVQGYSFQKFTLFETLEILKTLGVHHVELWPSQTISKDLTMKLGPGMPPEALTRLKAQFVSTGVTPVAYGVIRRFPSEEKEARALFAWVKDLGITTINAEPKPTDSALLDLISRLCDEYQVNVGIHDHANPSTYWNPQTVLNAIQGRSLRFGACADTGHWTESGLIPVDCLKQLAGRVKSIHLRNVDTDKHLPALFAELKRQSFQGVISYEGGGPKAKQDVVEFVKALNTAATAP